MAQFYWIQAAVNGFSDETRFDRQNLIVTWNVWVESSQQLRDYVNFSSWPWAIPYAVCRQGGVCVISLIERNRMKSNEIRSLENWEGGATRAVSSVFRAAMAKLFPSKRHRHQREFHWNLQSRESTVIKTRSCRLIGSHEPSRQSVFVLNVPIGPLHNLCKSRVFFLLFDDRFRRKLWCCVSFCRSGISNRIANKTFRMNSSGILRTMIFTVCLHTRTSCG